MSYMSETDAGRRIFERCEAWAKFSRPGPGVTRLYLTPEHRQAADQLIVWMEEAGMRAHMDEAGNIVGRYAAAAGGGPYLILGSHQDSVVEGGKYDGPAGVLTALDCVAALNAKDERLPFGIEVVAFGDEEGVRFRTTLAGSRAIAGDFGEDVLNAQDAEGRSLREALADFGLDPARVGEARHDPAEVLGYVELHIEQGPVLEKENLSVGVVTGINAQRRSWLRFSSETNHAGTVPMALRADALAAAARAVLIVEETAAAFPDTVGTVGIFEARPGVANVICGQVRISLDLRSPREETLERAYREIMTRIETETAARHVAFESEINLDLRSCPCSEVFIEKLEAAIEGSGLRPLRMPSGAGHDAMAMQKLGEVGMLFMRCRKGVSHNPAESVTPEDLGVAAEVMLRFIRDFRR